jgi:hypothetical protein
MTDAEQYPTHLPLTDSERASMMGEHGAVMASRIIEWLALQGDDRAFHRRDVEKDLIVTGGSTSYERDGSRQARELISRALRTLCVGGFLEPAPGKNYGWYRQVNKELVEQDVQGAEGEATDLWLPLGLSDKVKLFPGDIGIFAGTPNVGKTCFTLNIALENAAKDFEINYFNSEMSSIELKERIELFNAGWDAWNGVKFYRRSENFQDVVFGGKNVINIIDFLQVHDEFYKIGATLFEIHKRLNDSICIINMQKNPGQDTALGGFRTLELPRLAVAIESGKCKITKAKAWRDKEKNPNGSSCKFKLVHGHDLIPYNRINFEWMTTVQQQTEGTK